MIIVAPSFSKSSVFLFYVHTKTQSRRFKSNLSVFKRFFLKAPFSAAIARTVGVSVEIKLRFQIAPA